MRIVGTDVRPSLGTGDANLRPWALDKMPDERVVPLTERGRKKVSGNFKNAKYWRLEWCRVFVLCKLARFLIPDSGLESD